MDEVTKEMQQNELAALQAIFMDDFRWVETKTAWKVAAEAAEFEIVVRAPQDALRDRVWAGLRVRLPRTYPRAAPQLALERGEGLSDAQVAAALGVARREAARLAGSEMVYELAIAVGEFIGANNSAALAARPSFHQQMVERQHAGRQAALERAAAQRRQQQAADAAEHERLQALIRLELERKQQHVLSDQQRQRRLADIADAVHSVAGRWAEGIQLLRFAAAVHLDPLIGRFTTVALEESAAADPDGLCAVYDAYPTDLAGAGMHLADRFTVQCVTATAPHYLTDQGRRQLERVRARVADLARIRHPHLVSVYACHTEVLDARSHAPRVRLSVLGDALSPHDGATLDDVLASCGAIAAPQARAYLRHILLALVSLHASGFVHRAVAPANVLLAKDRDGGRRFAAKLFNTGYREELIDLHRVTPLSDAIADSVGCDTRVAPEAVDRADMRGRKNDVWCAAAVGLQMALGLDALRGVAVGHEPAVLAARRAALPGGLARVLARMLAPDPRLRPSAMEVLADPFFAEGLGGEPSVHRQALDSASRGLTFDVQRAARIAADAEGPGAEPPSAEPPKAPRPGGNSSHHAAARKAPKAPPAGAMVHFMRPSASRYLTDFEEVAFLGKGGFGSVVKARNRIDGRHYAIKKIKLDARDTEGNKKIFREVTTLSRLHHQNVVRYYTTWVEDLHASDSAMSGIPEEDDEESVDRTSDYESAPRGGGHGSASSYSSWSESGSDSDDSSSSNTSNTSSNSSSSSSSPSCSDSDFVGSDANQAASELLTATSSSSSSSKAAGAQDSQSTDAHAPSKSGGGGSGASNVFSAIRFGTMRAESPNKRDRTRSVMPYMPRRDSKPVREFPIEFADPAAHATTTTTTTATTTTEDPDSPSELGESTPMTPANSAGLSDKLLREHQAYQRTRIAGPVVAAPPRQKRRKHKQSKILYIQMEYCENKTLNDVIKEGLDEKEGWRLFGQILEGLSHIHQRGVIHRDLKPVNTFLDGVGDIKIGDFGLATSSFAPIDSTVSRHVSLDRSSAEDAMTADIGTSTYVAPEVTTKSSGATRYNQKVDMYSLGIIFFEMCYPLHTGMERATVLHNLRKPEIVFPDDFPFEKMQLQYQIIKHLLNHNPRARFSSAELLESDLLPPKMEDEYLLETIKTIANPVQPYFAKLMDSLFAHPTDKHIDATFDYRSNDIQAEQLNAVFLDRIRELMTRVFRTHAAVELSTPALTPQTELLDTYQRPALYLDPKGNVVQLPFDQTVPFARYVARTKMTEIKRYCFDRYFVANAAGGQPVSYTAASFDAVTNRSAHAVAAAEVVSVACEVFDELPAFRNVPTVLMINHMCILDAILAYCGILHPEWTVAADRKQADSVDPRPEEKKRQAQFVRNVCFFLGGLYKEKAHVIRHRIQVMSLSTGLKLHSQSLDRLQIFMDIRGDLNTVQREVLARIGSECGMSGTAYSMRGAEYVQGVVRAFNELRYVEATVRHFGRAIPFVYSPLFNHHYSYYEGGYAFQIMTDRPAQARAKHPQVLAVGGRYDGLLARFRHLAGSYSLAEKSTAAALKGGELPGGLLPNDADRKARGKAAGAGTAAAAKAGGAANGGGGGGDVSTAGGAGSGEASSMAFARRAGSVHSTDVWQQIYGKGGSDSGSRHQSPALASGSEPPLSPGSVAIGTNLSAGSAVLGTARDVVCVGVQIQLDLVIQEMARYQQQVLQAAETSSNPTFGLWTRKRCDVVIASFGNRPMLKERIALARELWASGLRTDFLFNDDPEMTMERLVDICRDQGMNWIVTLKRKAAGKRRATDAASTGPLGGAAGKGDSAVGLLSPDAKYVYKVKNILRRVECEVPRDSLSEWLHMDINEQYRLDWNTHEAKSAGTGLGDGAAALRHHSRHYTGLGSAHAAAKLAGGHIGSGLPSKDGAGLMGGGGASGSSSQQQQQFAGPSGAGSGGGGGTGATGATSAGMAGGGGGGGAGGGAAGSAGAGAGRLELVVVNPQQQPAKNLNRTKHKQKLLLTERAMLGVNRIMSEAKSAPVLVFELGDELLRRLCGEPSILSDAGYKRVLELCSAHQRAYVVELRSHMARFQREGCSYVWLYSAKGDCASTYKL
ncbi:eukaryotic translation initiation factor 2-alpha kinase [Coemansia thaxteri]|uniref:non-specific serine/threonine protein kinase n=1 Tax=Coemansia thaxteri TaxID=2663907 RepID=A0A9W8BFB4_9FUNG|nr:eukaryotic translation initiation factor 2-alpha kinase [Coemansia thaxteri]KAJ2488200.1 eukaryotic translation initiation factor 2-alpha kinase [Coemansia sp. RSA 2320]